MVKEKMTTIAVPMKVKEGIQKYGMKGETYGEILERLLKSAHERLIHDVLMNTEGCITLEKFREDIEKEWPKSK